MFLSGEHGESNWNKDPIKLTEDYIIKNGKSFKIIHGFRWTPPYWLLREVQEKLKKEVIDGK
jgi:hypothetical protein